MTAKSLPKSLHTVTALVRLAAYFVDKYCGDMTPEDALTEALAVLGYGEAQDPYGLAAAALKQLKATT